MKRLMVILILIILLAVGWRISSRLSADAIGLATGVVFGVLAGLPAAILVLASNRRKREEHDGQPSSHRNLQNGAYPYGSYPYQPPVIVLANPGAQPQVPQVEENVQHRQLPVLPPPAEEPRQFRIIGEPGEFEEEYP